jgi:protein-S-isoprenylcysteine O-methyltransferase Ste14
MKNRITPDGFFIILPAIAILLNLIFPIVKIVFFPFNLIGIILIIIGILMTLWTNSLLLDNRTAITPYEIPSFLITSGPFKYSRNPLYLGMAVALFGLGVFLGSLSPIFSPIIFVLVIERLFAPMEENNLEKKFGKKYLDYKKKVRLWI